MGVERIGIVLGDREFIGHQWLKYLKDQGIDFCVRVPKHHQIERLDGRRQNIEDLATKQFLYLKDCMVDDVWVNVSLKKLGEEDYLFFDRNPKRAQIFGTSLPQKRDN